MILFPELDWQAWGSCGCGAAEAGATAGRLRECSTSGQPSSLRGAVVVLAAVGAPRGSSRRPPRVPPPPPLRPFQLQLQHHSEHFTHPGLAPPC
ncbi:Hypothetical protein NTJ_04024 [Nesidiocoris tenuis]|uniref:Uncharacterized protein n=1 Tax=Nesidiocoris tenuis TaxID=355587 RepID=A0ABN7AIW3_9HEMI|nr:Hypothetical protein NTJ_04024 [Nesidiocoris tenuis]